MWVLRSNLVNGIFFGLSTWLQCVCLFVCKSISDWACPGGLCEGQSSREMLERAGSLAVFSSLHCFSLSAGHVMLLQYHCFGFLVLCYQSFLSSAQHVPQCFFGSHPSCLVIFQPPATAQSIHILMLWVQLCPISSACLCMSLHAYGCQFCVVHWLLFCHYMLQIGGFVFYEDVCPGDWQVKHWNSLLAQQNIQDPLSAASTHLRLLPY